MSVFKNEVTWSVIVSVIAVILSQLPPIKTWFGAPNVEAEIPKRIGLPNNFGITGSQFVLTLRNSGTKTARVATFSLLLSYPDGRDGRKERTLPLHGYSRATQGATNPVVFPLATVALQPGETWIEDVGFFPTLTTDDEREIGEARVKVAQSIRLAQAEVSSSFHPPPWPPEAGEAEVKAAVALFHKNFDLVAGKYRMQLKATVNDQSQTLKEVSFTLYEYHISAIQSQTEDFRYGHGILSPIQEVRQVWVQTEDG